MATSSTVAMAILHAVSHPPLSGALRKATSVPTVNPNSKHVVDPAPHEGLLDAFGVGGGCVHPAGDVR
jgi:hypothetical protein